MGTRFGIISGSNARISTAVLIDKVGLFCMVVDGLGFVADSLAIPTNFTGGSLWFMMGE